jgi:hypothetical protein
MWNSRPIQPGTHDEGADQKGIQRANISIMRAAQCKGSFT